MRSNGTAGSGFRFADRGRDGPSPEGGDASAATRPRASAHLQLAAVFPEAAPSDEPSSPYDQNSNVIIDRRDLEAAGGDGASSDQSDLDLIAPTLESSIAPAAGPGAGSPGAPTPDPDGEPDNGSLGAFNTAETFQFLEFGTGSGGQGSSFPDPTTPVLFDPDDPSTADLTLLQVIVTDDGNGVVVLDTGPQPVPIDSALLDGTALAPVIVVPPPPPLPSDLVPPPVVVPPPPGGTTNGAPTANDDSFSTSEPAVVVGGNNVGNVILTTPGQDSDPDGDGLSVTTVTTPVPSGFAAAGVNVTSIVPGTLNLGQAARYIINTSDGTADFVVGIDGTVSLDGTAGDPFNALGVAEAGTFTVTYTISDGNGGTDSATAAVSLVGDNDFPVAVADTLTTSEDDVAGGSNFLGDLTPGTPGQDFDPDGDSLTVVFVSTPTASFPFGVGVAPGVAGSGEAARFAISTSDGTADLIFGEDGSVNLNGTGGDPFDALATGDAGEFTFSYVISDANGGGGSTTSTILVGGDSGLPITITSLSASPPGLTSSLAAPGEPPALQSADSLLLEDLLSGSDPTPESQTGDGGFGMPVPPIIDSTTEGTELLISA